MSRSLKIYAQVESGTIVAGYSAVADVNVNRKGNKNEEVAVGSLFGVISAILRQSFDANALENLKWLIDALNSIKIGEDSEKWSTLAATSASSAPLRLDQVDQMKTIREDNIILKADLDLALAELNALRDKVNNFSSENNDQDNSKKEEKINKRDEDNEEDVWTSISDVCEKYQAPLASLIVDQVHNTEVAQMLSDVAKTLAEKTDPKKAFETMLGESAPTFFQSLRVQTAVKDSRPRLADVAEYHKPRSN